MDLSFLVYKAGVAMSDGHGLCHHGQSMEWLWPVALWQHNHPEHCEWRCHVRDSGKSDFRCSVPRSPETQ